MKQIGRFNVSKTQLDEVFTEGHKGISISTMGDKAIVVSGFVLYDMGDNTKSLKLFDTAGRDYFTSSQVFIKNLVEYFQTLDDSDFPATIHVVEAKSSKGRTYYTIEEAVPGDNNNSWRNITF